MTFDEFMEEVNKAYGLLEKAEWIRDSYDDYGAIPGCDCGCGGDTFDWDAQDEAYEEARELEYEAQEIFDKLREVWEEK